MLLVPFGNRHDPSTQASLERLTVESTQLLGCLKAFSPAVSRSVCQGRLDAGHTLPAQELDLLWFASLQASTHMTMVVPCCIACSTYIDAFVLLLLLIM